MNTFQMFQTNRPDTITHLGKTIVGYPYKQYFPELHPDVSLVDILNTEFSDEKNLQKILKTYFIDNVELRDVCAVAGNVIADEYVNGMKIVKEAEDRYTIINDPMEKIYPFDLMADAALDIYQEEAKLYYNGYKYFSLRMVLVSWFNDLMLNRETRLAGWVPLTLAPVLFTAFEWWFGSDKIPIILGQVTAKEKFGDIIFLLRANLKTEEYKNILITKETDNDGEDNG